MITTSLNQLAGIVEGELQGSDCQIESVSTDTRTIGGLAHFLLLWLVSDLMLMTSVMMLRRMGGQQHCWLSDH